MRHAKATRLLWGGPLLALTMVSQACGGAESVAAENVIRTAVQLAPDNVVTASLGEIASGPSISGQLTPAREAKVRTQVGGSIISLKVDRGMPVTANTEIARIASRDLEVMFASAEAAVKSAEIALTLAKAEAQRTATLVSGGALAARDLEQAANAVSGAEAQLAATQARQRSAWQQLDDTIVRAPFGGIVSERPASLGDVVAPGAEILTVIDLSSLRLEALVPSDQIQQVRPGATARFRIRGADGEFVGKVDRLSPTADPATRQVAIFVTIPNAGGKLIAGLFAEGRVVSAVRKGIVVPLSAVDETGPTPLVTRIRHGQADRVAVTLGVRQTDTEQVEVTGITAGDLLVVGSAKGIASGTAVAIIK